MNQPSLSHPSSSQERTTGSVAQDTCREAQPFVGGSPEHRQTMTDAEREAHIRSCGYLMEAAMRNWNETGDFGFRGEADRWRLLMEQAIKGRSPEQVARMERERGLA